MLKVYHSLPDVPLSEEQLTVPLPLGPESLNWGVLPNGLKYFVRPCAKPKHRAAVALAIRVGSVAEEDHEQGVAHIVEHLAFNATEGFSNHEIIKFLEKVGAPFGACQNAYTTADETVFELTLPTDQDGLLNKAISVMAEFAFKIRVAQADLDKERGAVLEEWRMSRDAQGRTAEGDWRFIMDGCKYADRLPIGTETIIKTVPAAVVLDFYTRWYRPENMALVVVGDFKQADVVVDSIKANFSSPPARLQGPLTPIPRIDFAPHEKPRYRVHVDKEVHSPTVYVSFKHPRPKLSTPQQYMEYLTERVFSSVMITRMFKLSRKEDPPFVTASTSEENMCATTSCCILSASCYEGQVTHALEVLLTEVARVRLHGISEKEMNQAKSQVMAETESRYLERDQGYCWDIRDEYVRHFLHEEFVTGEEYESRLSKTLLPRITVEAVAACALKYHPSCSCVVKTTGHKKTHTEQDLQTILERVLEQEKQGLIGPYQEGDGPEELMSSKPIPGEISSERRFEAVDATELTLSNGVRVCFKQTDFLEDEVLISGFACGGLSEVPESEFLAAAIGHTAAVELGVYGHKPTELEDILMGKRVVIEVSEPAYTRAIGANCSPRDMETALQLIHLLFTTRVKIVEKELKSILRSLKQNHVAAVRDPRHRFRERLQQINYGNCYFFNVGEPEYFDTFDAHAAIRRFDTRFKNPKEFTFVFTGKVSREQLEPLVKMYLASIPAIDDIPPMDPRSVTPIPWSFPAAPVVEDVAVPMIMPITQAQLTFPVELTRSVAKHELVWLVACCRLLETKLLQKMRFEFGDVYTVGVATFFGLEPVSNPGNARGEVTVSFTCDPDNGRRLVDMVLAELSRLQEEGPTQEEVETLVALEQREFETSLQENGYWHEVIASAYKSKTYLLVQNVDEVYQQNLAARKEVLAQAAPATMREAMRRLFPYPCTSRYTAVRMLPKPPLLQRILYNLATSSTAYNALVVVGIAAVAALGWAGLRTWRSRKL